MIVLGGLFLLDFSFFRVMVGMRVSTCVFICNTYVVFKSRFVCYGLVVRGGSFGGG